MNQKFSFLQDIPKSSTKEIFDTIIQNDNVKIERIVSYGQTTPKDFWYDQDEDEFVLVLDGIAKIQYQNSITYTLNKGDSLYIPKHQKHQVVYTQNPTIWLAVFISSE